MVSLDATHEYTYRADGMRVRKTISGSGVSYVDSYYDGQMPIEEHAYRNGLTTSISRNGIGARGIDVVTHTESGQTSSSYPLYDAHGNNVATLTKGSGSTYTVGNRRTYDAWGAVRSGTTGGKQKYVANLGHVEDEESGLLYMRARYYEPSSGRFLSEDPRCAGANYYVYANNNPVLFTDPTGRIAWIPLLLGFLYGFVFNAVSSFMDQMHANGQVDGWQVLGSALGGGLLGMAGGAAAGPMLKRSPQFIRMLINEIAFARSAKQIGRNMALVAMGGAADGLSEAIGSGIAGAIQSIFGRQAQVMMLLLEMDMD